MKALATPPPTTWEIISGKTAEGAWREENEDDVEMTGSSIAMGVTVDSCLWGDSCGRIPRDGTTFGSAALPSWCSLNKASRNGKILQPFSNSRAAGKTDINVFASTALMSQFLKLNPSMSPL